MQEELNQFTANDVWELVPNPKSMTIIGTKWGFRNKIDENGIVSKNKAKLVAQGYNQQEGIDYDETYAPVARLESIRILLAYACALDFKLFQMDVKSAFFNGFINEEVYVAQPPGFIDFTKPNHVYRLKKALYGLKQDPKAWQILKIPYVGQCAFTNEWDLSSLSIFQDPEGPYHIELPTPEEIHRFLRFERRDPNRTIKSKNVVLSPNQVLTKENARATLKANLPYDMLLARLFRQIMELIPHLDNGIYNVVDRVMRPLALVQARKPQKDRGTQRARHSTSASSAYHHGSSSHQVDDDEEIQNEGTFRASTPSPTSYLNSLSPLTHH
ncbi:retrovirus-related pol polyprotein from transposon TNT 1-94 [Tanacetum coccineum]